MKKLIDLKINAIKKPKRLVNSRYALSPIFATLIILAVVTVLFIPVFIWATGTSNETEDFWETSGLTVTERLVIEEVNLKTDDCTIYVRNIGKTDVTIDNIFITSPDGQLHVFTLNDFTLTPEYVIQGELITIKDLNLAYSQGTYIIKVFTPRGVSDTYQLVVE